MSSFLHNVEFHQFFCNSDFTWKQFYLLKPPHFPTWFHVKSGRQKNCWISTLCSSSCKKNVINESWAAIQLSFKLQWVPTKTKKVLGRKRSLKRPKNPICPYFGTFRLRDVHLFWRKKFRQINWSFWKMNQLSRKKSWHLFMTLLCKWFHQILIN